MRIRFGALISHARPPVAGARTDIWAVCCIFGFGQVQVYRQMLTTPKRQLALPLQLGLSRLLGLDPAYGLLVFAHR